MKVQIDKDLFKEQIILGLTTKDLQEYWNCSRTTINDRKKNWGFVGLSPNSKELDRNSGEKMCLACKTTKSFSDFYSNGKTPTGKIKYKPNCKSCEQEINSISYYKKIKEILEEDGRNLSCELCGYNTNLAALNFHHHTGVKNFGICEKSKTTSKDILRPEIKICKVLCSNCHIELHNPVLGSIKL